MKVAKNYESNLRQEETEVDTHAGAKNNGFKALTSQYITYANAHSANEGQRKVEKRTPAPVREALAIHPYLDIQGDGQRTPKVRLNVVCTSHTHTHTHVTFAHVTLALARDSSSFIPES